MVIGDICACCGEKVTRDELLWPPTTIGSDATIVLCQPCLAQPEAPKPDTRVHTIPIDTPVVILEAQAAFELLSDKEQHYACHLGHANWVGAKTCLLQFPPESVPIVALLLYCFAGISNWQTLEEEILRSDDSLAKDEVAQAVVYPGAPDGKYKCSGDTKFVPALPEERFNDVLECVLVIDNYQGKDKDKFAELWEACRDRMYSFNPRQRQLGLGAGEGIVAYFLVEEGASIANSFWDFIKLSAYNTRYQIRLPSVSTGPRDCRKQTKCEVQGKTFTIAPGAYELLIQRIIDSVQGVIPYCANSTQPKMLEQYLESFTTDNDDVHNDRIGASKTWSLGSAKSKGWGRQIMQWILFLIFPLCSRRVAGNTCVDENVPEELWMDGLPSFIYDRFNFVNSRSEMSLSVDKKNILCLHGLPDDNTDATNQYLRNPASRRQFAKIVFGSVWQQRQYSDRFGGPFEQGVVLKPSIVPLPTHQKDHSGPIRLMYRLQHDRDAGVMLPVFRELYEASRDRISLEVYASCGTDEGSHSDLIDACRQQSGCNYHGAVTKDEMRKALLRAHVFIAPPNWEPTSSLPLIEALGAGCEVVAPNIGALPEILNGFGVIYSYTQDKTSLTRSLGIVSASYWGKANIKKRRMQQLFAAQIYNWGFFGYKGRVEEWVTMLAAMEMDLNGQPPTRSTFESGSKYVEALVVAGRMKEAKGDSQQALQFYVLAHALDPQNSHILIALGSLGMEIGNMMGNSAVAYRAVEHLQFALSSTSVRPPILRDTAVYYEIAIRLGVHLIQLYKDKPSYKWFDNGLMSLYPHDDCWAVFRATNVMHLPSSPEEEVRNIENYHRRINGLLEHDFLMCSNANAIGSVFPVAYYDLDFKEELQAYVALLTKSFPWLTYHSPGLVYEDRPSISLSSQTRPIRVGVLSSFMEPKSSIWGSFGMTVRFLQTHPQLNVSLIYYPRQPIQEHDKILSLTPETNVYLDKLSDTRYDVLSKNRRLIEEREFDVLLYLDLWMTMEMHQLALAKLAPVQICTHGHPVTSAVPRKIMDYYLSWEAAELSNKTQAQSFYTEELVLLPPSVWEFYEPRSTPAEYSITGPSFGHYTRQTLDFIPTERDRELLLHPYSKWYFCAQSTFKFHITFDKILGMIQNEDPHAVLILIQLTEDLNELFLKTEERLAGLGHVDLSRVVWIPRMNHPRLMAMYKLSDVVLDSVYFGGDTTSREAFETGAPVITLPHKTIGQRWTQAYYKMMGIYDFIAKDPGDYARIAVEVANRPKAEQLALREKIKRAAHEKLFRSHDGYPEWAKALIDIAYKPRRWHWKNQPRGNAIDGRRDEL